MLGKRLRVEAGKAPLKRGVRQAIGSCIALGPSKSGPCHSQISGTANPLFLSSFKQWKLLAPSPTSVIVRCIRRIWDSGCEVASACLQSAENTGIPLSVRQWSLGVVRDKVQFINKQRRNEDPGSTNNSLTRWDHDDR
jgi:hypothetical protein